MKFEIYECTFNKEIFLQENELNSSYESAYQQYIVSSKKNEYKYQLDNNLITVVIPAYNVEKWIGYTLDSIIAQSYKNWECFVIDDCSDDNTLEVVKLYRKKDSRIKYFKHRANGKLSAARNMGLILANGSYICFLDSDDLIMPNSFENRLNAIFLNNHYRLAGSYSGSHTINEHAKTPPASYEVKNMRPIDFITAAGMCPFNANQPMFKTTVLRKMGGFDTRFTQAEDWEFWLRILRHGYLFIPTNNVDVTYRKTPGSMVRREPLRHLETSNSIYTSSHKDLAFDKQFSDTPFIYKKAWIHYKTQLDFANRTIEFCGMDIARINSVSPHAIKTFLEIMPDYKCAILPHRDLSGRLLVGIKRQLGNVSESAINYQCRELINEFTSEITKNSKEGDELNELTYDSAKSLSPAFHRSVEILFIPHKDYHLWSFSHYFKTLKMNDIKFAVLDISVIHRNEGVRSKAKELGIHLIEYSEFVLGEFSPKLLVCMNDWCPHTNNIITQAKKLGISTLAIVEGIQDYNDSDTGRSRNAYKAVDHVILPGRFDKKYFKNSDQNIVVGGLTRIDELILESNNAKFPEKPTAIINSNFTYNVLTEHRDKWVAQAVEACKRADIDYVISQHPADEGDYSRFNLSEDTMYNLIRSGSVFISRFGSGILESLAMGKPVIYFNPHNEKVDKFSDPLGAYEIADSVNSLVKAIKSTLQNKEQYLSKADNFLLEHCGTNSEMESTATLISNQVFLDIFTNLDHVDIAQRAKLKYLLMSHYQLTVFPFKSHSQNKPVKSHSQNKPVKPDDTIKKSDLKTLKIHKKNGSFHRKYRKFKRDPHLFFYDINSPVRILRYVFRKKYD